MITEGQRIGSYRLVRQIGAGGMGTVWEGVHEQIERRAAIKLLKPELSRDAGQAQRFFNEARAANIIHHPGIVSIFEFGQLPDGEAYIVMEYLEGESLKARIRRLGPEAGPDAPRLGRQIASALAAAHDKGIVHRDLKPDNVMIVPDPDVIGGERAKVLDFGIAKLAEEHRRPEDASGSTRTGIMMGTPTYMAPEQCQGAGSVDARADVYSLGVILYQCVAGRAPFVGGEGQVIGMHLFVEPRQLADVVPSVEPDLAVLVHEMLAKDPASRPAMTEVARRLAAIGAGQAGRAGEAGMGSGGGRQGDDGQRAGQGGRQGAGPGGRTDRDGPGDGGQDRDGQRAGQGGTGNQAPSGTLPPAPGRVVPQSGRRLAPIVIGGGSAAALLVVGLVLALRAPGPTRAPDADGGVRGVGTRIETPVAVPQVKPVPPVPVKPTPEGPPDMAPATASSPPGTPAKVIKDRGKRPGHGRELTNDEIR